MANGIEQDLLYTNVGDSDYHTPFTGFGGGDEGRYFIQGIQKKRVGRRLDRNGKPVRGFVLRLGTTPNADPSSWLSLCIWCSQLDNKKVKVALCHFDNYRNLVYGDNGARVLVKHTGSFVKDWQSFAVDRKYSEIAEKYKNQEIHIKATTYYTEPDNILNTSDLRAQERVHLHIDKVAEPTINTPEVQALYSLMETSCKSSEAQEI